MLKFFVQKWFKQLFSSYILALQFFVAIILAQKSRVICWWNWHQGSISLTYLCTAFKPVAPKRVGVQSNHRYHFTLLRSVGIKAARRMLMKLTPEINGKKYLAQCDHLRRVFPSCINLMKLCFDRIREGQVIFSCRNLGYLWSHGYTL